MRLLKQHQLYRNEPQNGIPGDCYRTAIACMLGMPAHRVPHFVLESWKGKGTTHQVTQDWLAGLGWQLASVQYACGLDDLQDLMHAHNRGIVYMLSGKSPRGNWSHVVIARAGRIIWDPAPADSHGWGGLDGPCPETGMYEIEFFVPLVETR